MVTRRRIAGHVWRDVRFDGALQRLDVGYCPQSGPALELELLNPHSALPHPNVAFNPRIREEQYSTSPVRLADSDVL